MNSIRFVITDRQSGKKITVSRPATGDNPAIASLKGLIDNMSRLALTGGSLSRVRT